MDDTVNAVIDHIRPGPCRLEWDSLMTSMDILEQFEEVFLETYIYVCVLYKREPVSVNMCTNLHWLFLD